MKKTKISVLIFAALFGATQMSAVASNGDSDKQYAAAYSAINDSITKNDIDAVVVLSQLAEKKHPQSIMAMGEVYGKGVGVKQDFAKAATYYNQVINMGYPGAKKALKELEANKSYASRINSIRQGVKQGNAKSCGELGWCYANGIVIDFDNERAIECFNLGAEKNDAFSMYQLGLRYYMGYGVAQDVDKAVKLIEKAAQGGNADAQYQMALMCDEAYPLTKNNAAAVAWYDKAVAQNHSGAMYNSALQYLNGSSRAENATKAVELLQKASEQGNAEAAYLLGSIYEDGKGVKGDVQSAVKYYTLAFENGCYDAAASLARVYMFDFNDKTNATKWLDVASKYGVLKGEYYRFIMQNVADVKTLEKKSKNKDVTATKMLAICYHEGFGVKKDDKKSFKYMKEAAKTDRDACYQLAQYYVNGIGTKKDYKKAVECFVQYDPMCAEVELYSNAAAHQNKFNSYKQLANTGNAEGYFMLHLCYKHGFGVEQNSYMSHEMLVNAAALGHKFAQRELSAYWAAKDDAFSAVKSQYWTSKYQVK